MKKYENTARLISALSFLLLIIFGLFNMWSISQKLSSPHFKKHVVIAILCLVSFSAGFLIANRFPKRTVLLGIFVFIISVALLVFVSFKGKSVFGSRRWISVGGLIFQPTEIAKISAVILTAYAFALRKLWRSLLISAVVNFIPAYLVAKQPDFGSAATFLVVFLSGLFFSRFPTRVLVIGLIMLIISAPLIWEFGLKEYHRKRITAFLNPERDYLFTGYQTVQSLLAIGSGGFSGMGFAQGEHSRGKWIPNLHSDFAVVSIAEDFGFLGVLAVLGVIFLLLSSLMARAFFSEQKFTQNLNAFFSMLLAFHMLINILMVVGLFPVVGIPLTFISYGGTHNTSMALLLGICVGISEYRKGKITF